jgi:hypothetical protein
MFRRRWTRLLVVALLAAATNVMHSWDVLALQNRLLLASLALDALWPWVGLLGFVWLVDAETWRERLSIAAATSAGLLVGKALVFALFDTQ